MNLNDIISLAKQNQGHKALAELKSYLDKNQQDQQALFYAGLWCFQSMDWKNAEVYMEKLITLAPDNVEYLNNMLGMYMNMSNVKKAIQFQLKLIELTSDSAEQNYNLAMLYHRINDFGNALVILQKLHQQHPQNVQVIGVIADIVHGFGDFKQAIEYYKLILSLEKFNESAFNGIVKSIKFTQVDEELLSLANRMLASSQVSNEAKAQVNISLGKMYDDCKKFEQAWQYYCAGNLQQQQLFPHDKHALNAQVNIIKSIFTKELVNDSKTIGDKISKPIFIVGMPRSGTTLLEQVLEHSGETCAGGESLALNKAINREFYNIRFPDEIAKVTAKTYQNLAEHYLNYFKNCHVNGDLRTVDKLPGNFLHLGLLKKMFPNIKIINLSRNKDDCSLSIFFQMFANHMTFTTDMENISNFHQVYQSIMAYWQELFADNIYNLSYEDFVNDFEHKTKDLYQFLELDWNENVGNFIDSKNSVQTPSSWQVRQGINNKSVGRSANYTKLMVPR
ncbi:MAG: hypothetical protein COB35_00625 [Gammaproteobacteria bacterium]|nr:MAG: hypothetical protein COB35_00625 [Gammaproteobacteria bacterium]